MLRIQEWHNLSNRSQANLSFPFPEFHVFGRSSGGYSAASSSTNPDSCAKPLLALFVSYCDWEILDSCNGSPPRITSFPFPTFALNNMPLAAPLIKAFRVTPRASTYTSPTFRTVDPSP